MSIPVVFTQKGQTLLEVVVSVGVVALVVLGLVAAVTSSLRFGQSSRYRSRAVKYAQEGMELTRQLRDTKTWSEFQAYAAISGKTWCVNNAGVWTTLGGGSCTALDNIYTRTLSMKWTDPIVQTVVTVSWQDGSTQYSTNLESYFTQWK